MSIEVSVLEQKTTAEIAREISEPLEVGLSESTKQHRREIVQGLFERLTRFQPPAVPAESVETDGSKRVFEVGDPNASNIQGTVNVDGRDIGARVDATADTPGHKGEIKVTLEDGRVEYVKSDQIGPDGTTREIEEVVRDDNRRIEVVLSPAATPQPSSPQVNVTVNVNLGDLLAQLGAKAPKDADTTTEPPSSLAAPVAEPGHADLEKRKNEAKAYFKRNLNDHENQLITAGFSVEEIARLIVLQEAGLLPLTEKDFNTLVGDENAKETTQEAAIDKLLEAKLSGDEDEIKTKMKNLPSILLEDVREGFPELIIGDRTGSPATEPRHHGGEWAEKIDNLIAEMKSHGLAERAALIAVSAIGGVVAEALAEKLKHHHDHDAEQRPTAQAPEQAFREKAAALKQKYNIPDGLSKPWDAIVDLAAQRIGRLGAKPAQQPGVDTAIPEPVVPSAEPRPVAPPQIDSVNGPTREDLLINAPVSYLRPGYFVFDSETEPLMVTRILSDRGEVITKKIGEDPKRIKYDELGRHMFHHVVEGEKYNLKDYLSGRWGDVSPVPNHRGEAIELLDKFINDSQSKDKPDITPYMASQFFLATLLHLKQRGSMPPDRKGFIDRTYEQFTGLDPKMIAEGKILSEKYLDNIGFLLSPAIGSIESIEGIGDLPREARSVEQEFRLIEGLGLTNETEKLYVIHLIAYQLIVDGQKRRHMDVADILEDESLGLMTDSDLLHEYRKSSNETRWLQKAMREEDKFYAPFHETAERVATAIGREREQLIADAVYEIIGGSLYEGRFNDYYDTDDSIDYKAKAKKANAAFLRGFMQAEYRTELIDELRESILILWRGRLKDEARSRQRPAQPTPLPTERPRRQESLPAPSTLVASDYVISPEGYLYDVLDIDRRGGIIYIRSLRDLNDQKTISFNSWDGFRPLIDSDGNPTVSLGYYLDKIFPGQKEAYLNYIINLIWQARTASPQRSAKAAVREYITSTISKLRRDGRDGNV